MEAANSPAPEEVTGTPLSFASVVHAHQGMVFSLAYHFLRNRAAAEEVTQDVFLQLHRNFGTLTAEVRLTHWLRKVASNRCIDYVRKRKFESSAGLDGIPEPSVSGEQGDLLLNRRLRALVASLPEKPRMVMVLRYQEDLMPEEISKILNMPVRTVKSHLQRSLALLREKMERQKIGIENIPGETR